MDGDGDADLAVANQFSDNISVLLNNGDGTFAADVLYGVGDGPWSVAIGDLDGDGDADLAVANGISDNVSVLLNNGDATLILDAFYDVGNNPFAIAIGDLDADADLDLIVASLANGNSVSVLLNNGDGTFAAEVLYGTGFGGPASVAIGDLDGDGDADRAVANGVGDDISVLLNRTIQMASAVAHSGGAGGPQSPHRSDPRVAAVTTPVASVDGDARSTASAGGRAAGDLEATGGAPAAEARTAELSTRSVGDVGAADDADPAPLFTEALLLPSGDMFVPLTADASGRRAGYTVTPGSPTPTAALVSADGELTKMAAPDRPSFATAIDPHGRVFGTLDRTAGNPGAAFIWTEWSGAYS